MLEFVNLKDIETKGKDLPEVLVNYFKPDLEVLDSEYGVDRGDYLKEDGGYVAILEDSKDFETIKERHDVDILSEDAVSEFNDKIIAGDKEYIGFLFLIHNEFGLKVICETKLLPEDSSYLYDIFETFE